MNSPFSKSFNAIEYSTNMTLILRFRSSYPYDFVLQTVLQSASNETRIFVRKDFFGSLEVLSLKNVSIKQFLFFYVPFSVSVSSD